MKRFIFFGSFIVAVILLSLFANPVRAQLGGTAGSGVLLDITNINSSQLQITANAIQVKSGATLTNTSLRGTVGAVTLFVTNGLTLSSNLLAGGIINATNGFATGASTGITTNLDVIMADTTTNQLRFVKGILTAVAPQ